MKKGFTLIELLAVIVILAIILLIAVPKIGDVIENVKRSSFESSSKMVVKAATDQYFQNQLSGINAAGTYLFTDGKAVGEDLNVSNFPGNGEVRIAVDGQIAIAIENGKYCAIKSFSGKIIIHELEGFNCVLADDITYVDIQNGLNHTLALTNLGEVYVMGNENREGQFGLGSEEFEDEGTIYTRPIYRGAALDEFTKINGLSNVSKIIATNSSSVAITTTGEVYIWGGQDVPESYYIPVHVPELKDTEISCSNYNSCFAIKSDGSVYVWGYNYNGQLALGNNTNVLYPVLNSNLTNIKSIFPNLVTSFAIKNDDTVVGWGDNYDNELPGLASGNYQSPVLVPLLNQTKTVFPIQSSRGGFFIKKIDGTISAFGRNSNGNLGIGNTTTPGPLTVIPTINNARKIISTNSYTLALMNDGRLYASGLNVDGVLGNAITEWEISDTFVQIATNVKDVTAYSNTIMYIDNANDLWISSRNDKAEFNDDRNPIPGFLKTTYTNVKKINVLEQRVSIISNDQAITFNNLAYSGV